MSTNFDGHKKLLNLEKTLRSIELKRAHLDHVLSKIYNKLHESMDHGEITEKKFNDVTDNLVARIYEAKNLRRHLRNTHKEIEAAVSNEKSMLPHVFKTFETKIKNELNLKPKQIEAIGTNVKKHKENLDDVERYYKDLKATLNNRLPDDKLEHMNFSMKLKSLYKKERNQMLNLSETMKKLGIDQTMHNINKRNILF